MDLTILFNPIDDSITGQNFSANSFFKSISAYGEKIPDYKQAHIAIFGVPEERGATDNVGVASGPDEIRKKLYHIKKGTGAYRIIDLGNLKTGIDLDETYVRLSEVCRMLLESNVLPIILGSSHDLDFGQYRGYEEMEKLINLLNIDAFIDIEDNKSLPASKQHIHKILLHEPNYLFGYTHLAHQLYLVDTFSAAMLEKLYF